MRPGRLVLVAAGVTIARATAYAVGKPSAALADRAYVLAIGAVAIYALLSLIDRHTSLPRRSALDDAARPPDDGLERPTRLAALEDLAAFAADKAQGVHFHLRPYVRDLFRDRLAAKGMRLDTDPGVPELVGPVAWELARPDRPPPSDGRDPGLTDEQLTALTDTLERMT